MKRQQLASLLLLLVLVGLLVSVRFHMEQPDRVSSGLTVRDTLGPGLMMEVGNALVARGDYLEAAVVFETLVAHYPNSVEAEDALCQAGLCWFSLDGNEQMGEIWERFLEKYPRSKYASSIRESYRMLKREWSFDSVA